MITAANYAQLRPDRATLTDAEQAGYDLIEAGGLEAYDLDAGIREAIDLYFAELNAKQGSPRHTGAKPTPKNHKSRKPTGRTPKARKGKALPKRKPAGPQLEQVKIDCRILESDDECVVEGITPGGDRLRFIMQEHEEHPTNEDDNTLYSYTVYAVAGEDDSLEDAPLVGRNRVATMWANKFGAQVVAFYEATRQAGLTTRKKEDEARLKNRERLSRRNTPRLPKPPVSAKPEAQNNSIKTAKASKPKPVKAKTPRAKKEKPTDTRTEVAHFDADLTIIRKFAALTVKAEKAVTIVNVRNQFRTVQKAIASRKVRKTSPYAPILKEIAELLAKALKVMEAKKITSVDKLDFANTALVKQARQLAAGVKLSDAVNLLSRFINLQGTHPEAKTVAALLKALDAEHAEHPRSDYAVAVGAAAATLRDWQPGRAVGISAQQLGRLGQLSGLGCACQDAPAAAVAGPPAAKRKAAAGRASLGSTDSIFTVIGEKDHRQAVGKLLHLPGDLGLFLGDIEDHEYALAIRGEKGAGKTRFLYQLKNLFASVGKRVASFSLEIAKNSDVVRRNTEAYIAPANRPRVLIASEAQGLDTIRDAASRFDVVAIDSWSKVPGVQPGDFDKLRKEFPNTLFLVIFQSTTAGTSRGGSSSEYDASAVCQVNLPGVAVMEKNRYANGAADELKYLVNEQRLAKPEELY